MVLPRTKKQEHVCSIIFFVSLVLLTVPHKAVPTSPEDDSAKSESPLVSREA